MSGAATPGGTSGVVDGGTVGIVSTRVPCMARAWSRAAWVVAVPGIGGPGSGGGGCEVVLGGQQVLDLVAEVEEARVALEGGTAVASERDGDHRADPARPGREPVDALGEVDGLLHVVGDHEDCGAGGRPGGGREGLHRPLGLGFEGP